MLLVLVLLIGGVLFIVDKTATRAKIPGVTYTLYTEGISLVKQHTTNEYRTEIIKLWRADQTGSAAASQQEGESQQITQLLPEKPLENDQLFVDTLLSIQDSIKDATATDAVAAITAGNTTLGSLSQESEKNWQLIGGKIAELEAATDASQLTAIRDAWTFDLRHPRNGATRRLAHRAEKGHEEQPQSRTAGPPVQARWFQRRQGRHFGRHADRGQEFQKGLGFRSGAGRHRHAELSSSSSPTTRPAATARRPQPGGKRTPARTHNSRRTHGFRAAHDHLYRLSA